MVPVQIKPLSENAYKDLFEFEQLNWDYFAKSIGSRPDSYSQRTTKRLRRYPR